MSEEGLTPIVIDTGACKIKAGFAQEEVPRVVFSSSVAREKNQSFLFGREALASNYCSPVVESGKIICQESLLSLWNMVLQEKLGALPNERPLLISISTISNKLTKEIYAQMCFEALTSPQIMLVSSSLLVLYSSGRTSGTIVDCGHSLCTAVPIDEGAPQKMWQTISSSAGVELDRVLAKELNFDGKDYSQLQSIKESHCKIPMHYETESKEVSEISQMIELPDGKKYEIGAKGLLVGEKLFNGEKNAGISHITMEAINKAETDGATGEVLSSIILSGGTTQMSGFTERLQYDLELFSGVKTKITVQSFADRATASWIGGSVIGTLGSFQPFWVSKAEYDECGPSLASRKCL